ELHCKVWSTFLDAHCVYAHDVGMLEGRSESGLAVKSGDGLRFGQEAWRQNLQGYSAVQRGLPRLIDDAHPSTACLKNDPEVAEVCPWLFLIDQRPDSLQRLELECQAGNQLGVFLQKIPCAAGFSPRQAVHEPPQGPGDPEVMRVLVTTGRRELPLHTLHGRLRAL